MLMNGKNEIKMGKKKEFKWFPLWNDVIDGKEWGKVKQEVKVHFKTRLLHTEFVMRVKTAKIA